MAGTAESFALQVARALEPLGDRLATPQGAVALFGELGVPLSPPVVTAIETAPQLPQVVGAVTDVAAQIPVLTAAIEAQDAAAIAGAVEAVAPRARDAFGGLHQLAETTRSAFGDTSGLGPELAALMAALPGRLVGWVLVRALEASHPAALRVLALPGILESTAIPASATDPAITRRAVHPDRLVALLDDPEQLLRDLYHWGDPGVLADAGALLARIGDLARSLGLDVVVDPGVPELRSLLIALRPAPGGPPTALAATLLLPSLTGLHLTLNPAGSQVTAEVTASGTLDVGAGLRIVPPATIEPVAPTGTVDGQLRLGVRRIGRPGSPLLLFGSVDGSRLTADSAGGSVEAAFSTGAGGTEADLALQADVTGGRIVVSLGGADGFLASVLPEEAGVAFDVGVRWSKADGVTFRGGAGLSIAVPLGIDAGPARIDRLDVGVRLSPGAVPTVSVESTFAGGISLGPIAATVDGVGAAVDVLLKGGSGAGSGTPGAVDLGPVAVALRFVPPTGLGLSIDAGPIGGGGFIDLDPVLGRYAGVFEVDVLAVGVQAVGLLDTRLPGGAGGYALLVLLRAQFPPIQIGFGFALSSVGGLLALNRRIDVDALRNRMASGTAGRILAPEDPVRNAPVLINDLGAVFPPAAGVVVVGPTLQVSWAELVRFDVGVFIELPGPRTIVLLGSARAAIENPGGGSPYLQIRLDILGVLDLAAKTLSFDAVLIDSQILQLLTLSGGAAFRASWGAEPYVVLTVGGFHPAYSPAPLVFPSSLTRVAMTGGNPVITFRFEGYFAVTTNSLQFGAAIEARIDLGPFNIRGFIGFDALIRFSPFHFDFQIAASVNVRWKSRNLAGLTLRGSLSGPGPITFRGKVCFEILWFDICFSETIRLGSTTPPAVTPVASAVAELAEELADPGNLEVLGGDDRYVVLAPAVASLPVVPPLGQVVWTQNRAPMDLLLQRFEGAPLTRPETVTATGPHVTGDAVDWFAPGSFAELSDSDALNRKSFERLHGGVRLGVAGLDDGPTEAKTLTVKQIRLPAPPRVVDLLSLPAWLMRATAGRLGQIERDAVVPALAVRDERWDVRAANGAVVAGGLSQAQAHQLASVGGAGSAVAAVDTVAAFAF